MDISFFDTLWNGKRVLNINILYIVYRGNNLVDHPSACREHFGYLSERSKGMEIPNDCVACPKSLDCMLLKPNNSDITTVRHVQSHESLESLLVGKTVREQKVLHLSRVRLNPSSSSAADTVARGVRVCAHNAFQAYCWATVQTMTIYRIMRSSSLVAIGLFRDYLIWVHLCLFECFYSFSRGLLRSTPTVKSWFLGSFKSVSLDRFRMSMSLMRRVKPSANVLHVEALGLTVNVVRTRRSS